MASCLRDGPEIPDLILTAATIDQPTVSRLQTSMRRATCYSTRHPQLPQPPFLCAPVNAISKSLCCFPPRHFFFPTQHLLHSDVLLAPHLVRVPPSTCSVCLRRTAALLQQQLLLQPPPPPAHAGWRHDRPVQVVSCLAKLGETWSASHFALPHLSSHSLTCVPSSLSSHLRAGLFRSPSQTVSPSRAERQAARTRLHRARSAVELRQSPSAGVTEMVPTKQQSSSPGEKTKSDGRPDFETESDITTYVEARIEESMRAGHFENLRNKGRPLGAQPRSATDYAMRMMRDAGVRPPWLQLMHDIDADVAAMRRMLAAARRRYGTGWQFHRAASVAEVAIVDINRHVDKFNIIRPMSFAHLFRLRLRVDDEVRRAVRLVAMERAAMQRAVTVQNTHSSPVAESPRPEEEQTQIEPRKRKEPRPSWQLYARFVRASEVREYDLVSWGRRRDASLQTAPPRPPSRGGGQMRDK